MHLKSFFAATVEEALAKGSRELGEEALIVQSRKAPPESRHLGEYEMVLAVTAPVIKGVAADPSGAGDLLARELTEMRRQLDAMRRSLSRSALTAPRWLAPSSQAAGIFATLVDSDVDAGLAQQVAEAVAARIGPVEVNPDQVARAAAEELGGRFSVDA